MFTDPLFLFSLVGILGCLFIWIKSNVTDATFNPYIEDKLSSISTFFFITMVMSIFYKSGDLGVILFIAVIICFAVFFIGLFFKNKENSDLRPKPGTLLIFPGNEEYEHGVRFVGEGPIRYVTVGFMKVTGFYEKNKY